MLSILSPNKIKAQNHARRYLPTKASPKIANIRLKNIDAESIALVIPMCTELPIIKTGICVRSYFIEM